MSVDVFINLVRERLTRCDRVDRGCDVIAASWKDIATEIKGKGELNSFYSLIRDILEYKLYTKLLKELLYPTICLTISFHII